MNVTITATTVKFAAPAGVTAGAFRFQLAQGTEIPFTQDEDGLSTTFAAVPSGDYIPMAFRVDVAGNKIGPLVAGPSFNVPSPTVDVDVPDAITVTLG